jgi:hypothetical protein
MAYCHEGRRDGSVLADRTATLWRATTAYDLAEDGRIGSGAFYSRGGDHISMCVADPNWEAAHQVPWMPEGCGIAAITVGDVLGVGFERVEWHEIEMSREGQPEYLPGHVNVYYGSSPPAIRRQAKDLASRAQSVRPPIVR